MSDQLSIILPRNEIEAELQRRYPKQRNPMVLKCGVGPLDKQCRSCKHLVYDEYGYGKRRYHKCALRGVSNSEATDHRLSWPACGRYETLADAMGLE